MYKYLNMASSLYFTYNMHDIALIKHPYHTRKYTFYFLNTYILTYAKYTTT